MREFEVPYVTDEELNKSSSRLTEGKCNWEIIEASIRKIRDSDNYQVGLKLKVWDKNGTEGILFDYLQFSQTVAWKWASLFSSAGKKYEPGIKYNYNNISQLERFSGPGFLKQKTKEKDGKMVDVLQLSYNRPSKDHASPSNAPLASNSSALPASEMPDDDIPF
jgi:hypothetical protein